MRDVQKWRVLSHRFGALYTSTRNSYSFGIPDQTGAILSVGSIRFSNASTISLSSSSSSSNADTLTKSCYDAPMALAIRESTSAEQPERNQQSSWAYTKQYPSVLSLLPKYQSYYSHHSYQSRHLAHIASSHAFPNVFAHSYHQSDNNNKYGSKYYAYSTSATPNPAPLPDNKEEHKEPVQPATPGAIDPSTVTWKEAKDPKKLWILIKRLPSDIVREAKHFWAGCKLLAADVRVSWKILKRILEGKELSRRERNLLVSTGADLARLVPFSFFVIVPFMEFALPFVLKMFPNMLPSQFQDQMKKEEDLKRQLKLRLELAKYLQDVVEEKAKVIKASNTKDSGIKAEAEQLTTFLDALRAGKPVDERDIFRFARLFSDEYTLEGAVRPQLVAMCRYMGISPYGSDAFLRIRLRAKLASIKQDDMQIMWEGGVDSLTDDEALKACRDRGIRTHGLPKRRMRKQLKDWLEMSQNRELPATLMILSRAFFFTDMPEEALKETLSSLPQDVLDDVRGAAHKETKLSAEARLNEVRRQEKLLEMEVEREKRLEEEKKKKKKEDEAAKREAEAVAAAAVAATSPPIAESTPMATDSSFAASQQPVPEPGWEANPDIAAKEKQLEQAVFGSAPQSATQSESPAAQPEVASEPRPELQPVIVGEGTPVPPVAAPMAAPEPSVAAEAAKGEEEKETERETVKEVAELMLRMMDVSAVSQERLDLEKLKAELKEATSKLDGVKEDSQLNKLNKMIVKLETEIETVDVKVGIKLKLLDVDNDGMVRMDEIKEAVSLLASEREGMEAATDKVLQRLQKDREHTDMYSTEDLRRSLRAIISENDASNPHAIENVAQA